MSSRRGTEPRARRLSSTAQSQSRLENMRNGLNGWFNGRSRVETLRRAQTPESPKTPRHTTSRHTLDLQNLPSTRLHLPYLSRNNSLSSMRDTESPASPRSLRSFRLPFTQITSRSATPRSVRRHSRDASADTILPRVHHQPGRRFVGVDPAELQLADLANAGRRRRRKKSRTSERTCGPKIKNKRIRAKIISCFISGMFLTLVLTIYLAMALSNRSESQEFHVLLILIILITTIFFCHSLIRLCMMIIKPPPDDELDVTILPAMSGPGGYANPAAPIPVTLARDEEAAGIESQATKLPPPAYGLWRESVRVDPNRIFWQRNAGVPERRPSQTEPRPTTANRPPSYISEDGIDYVVEAAPRSIAPTTDVPLPLHPSERGRVATLPR